MVQMWSVNLASIAGVTRKVLCILQKLYHATNRPRPKPGPPNPRLSPRRQASILHHKACLEITRQFTKEYPAECLSSAIHFSA